MAGLVAAVAKRALPGPARPENDPDEPLIEALMTGDIATLQAQGPGFATGSDDRGNPWFFIALESGSLATVGWFLTQGVSPESPDQAGRLPLEVVLQRALLGDDLDDALADCPAMARALIGAGAQPTARTVAGAALADLARMAGIDLA